MRKIYYGYMCIDIIFKKVRKVCSCRRKDVSLQANWSIVYGNMACNRVCCLGDGFAFGKAHLAEEWAFFLAAYLRVSAYEAAWHTLCYGAGPRSASGGCQ